MATKSDSSECTECGIVPDVWDDVFGQPLFRGVDLMAMEINSP